LIGTVTIGVNRLFVSLRFVAATDEWLRLNGVELQVATATEVRAAIGAIPGPRLALFLAPAPQACSAE
jgi:hypothetical protein